MKVSRRGLLLWAVAAAVAVTAAALFSVQPKTQPEDGDISGLRAVLESSIQKLGPSEAYAEMKRSYAKSSPDTQHNTSHLFGESLYALLKGEGISTCDPTFNFGCYHGFFTAAVKNEGIDSVSALDRVCQASLRPNVCQHGLGHGILEYLGHTNLSEALEKCALTYQPDPIAGCTSGVFMEYNVPLTVSGDALSVSARPLGDPEKPYEPCTDVAEKFRGSCYHELAQWWNQVYGGDFERMGTLCAAAPEEYGNVCFAGIGNVAGPSAHYNTGNAEIICRMMPDGGRDTCLQNAAWAFSSNVGDRAGGKELCERVSPENRERCLTNL